jgi:hypothetical protein
MELNDFKKAIASKLQQVLKPEGFKKNGGSFSKRGNGLTYYVSMQSSQGSSRRTLKFTINIEITSELLYELEDTSIPKAQLRHYRQRVGGLLPGGSDKWWVVENEESANATGDEVARICLERILPELYKVLTTEDLRAIWASGISPGLTDKMRREYLAMLGK